MSTEKVTNQKEESEEKSVAEKQAQEETKSETTEASENTEDKKEPTPEEQIQELNDRYLRLYSEFENFRRRTAKEKLELAKTASEGVMKDLLTVLDDFDRAQESFEKSNEVAALKEGVDLIQNKLFKTLEQKGLKPMDALHQEFDADIHEALTNIPAPSEELKGKVVDVIEKGYTLNDKIIRYAKVVVGN